LVPGNAADEALVAAAFRLIEDPTAENRRAYDSAKYASQRARAIALKDWAEMRRIIEALPLDGLPLGSRLPKAKE
jgi:hypothetical protein